jgi:ribosomal protein L30E
VSKIIVVGDGSVGAAEALRRLIESNHMLNIVTSNVPSETIDEIMAIDKLVSRASIEVDADTNRNNFIKNKCKARGQRRSWR